MLHEHLDILNRTTHILIKQHCWVLIDEEEHKLYISFRGTDSNDDFLMNFQFLTRSFDSEHETAKVHAGFMKYYSEVKTHIFEIVKAFKECHEDAKIIINGHSLGGAAAVLCSLDLVTKNVMKSDKVTCVTFGSPMIGNKEFCNLFEQNITCSFHIKCGFDIAPRIPIPGLKHVEHTIFIPMKTSGFCDLVNHHSMDTHLYAIKMRLPWTGKAFKCMNANICRPPPPKLKYTSNPLQKQPYKQVSTIIL
jgi:triacylglycerol lipase